MLGGLLIKMQKYGFSMRFDDMSKDIDGAVDVVCYLLDISLGANYYNYTLGPYGIKKISENDPELLGSVIEICIERIVDFKDDDLSRIETILLYSLPSYLPRFAELCVNSGAFEADNYAAMYIDGSVEDELDSFYSAPISEYLREQYSFWEKEISDLTGQ